MHPYDAIDWEMQKQEQLDDEARHQSEMDAKYDAMCDAQVEAQWEEECLELESISQIGLEGKFEGEL